MAQLRVLAHSHVSFLLCSLVWGLGLKYSDYNNQLAAFWQLRKEKHTERTHRRRRHPEESLAYVQTTISLDGMVTLVAVVTMVFKPHVPLPRAMRRYPFSPHDAPQLFLMIQYGIGVEPKPTIATP